MTDCKTKITITNPNDLITQDNTIKYFIADEIEVNTNYQMPSNSWVFFYANKINILPGLTQSPGARLLAERRAMGCGSPITLIHTNSSINTTTFQSRDLLDSLNQAANIERLHPIPYINGGRLYFRNSFEMESVEISIFDLLGKKIVEVNNFNCKNGLAISFPKSIYLYVIKKDNKIVNSGKFWLGDE
jgi:hypothetical protein